MFKKNNNKPTKATKLARSGNPAKRSQVEKAEVESAKKKQNKEMFLRVTGLVIVAVLGATLLVGAFGTSF
jgi:hypothetical protein